MKCGRATLHFRLSKELSRTERRPSWIDYKTIFKPGTAENGACKQYPIPLEPGRRQARSQPSRLGPISLWSGLSGSGLLSRTNVECSMLCTVEEYERLIWLGFGCSVMCRGATCSFICKPSVSQAGSSCAFFTGTLNTYIYQLSRIRSAVFTFAAFASSRRRRTPSRAARCRASSGRPMGIASPAACMA